LINMSKLSRFGTASVLAAGLAICVASVPASAATITGQLSLTGLANFNSTSIDFTGASTLIGLGGSFQELSPTNGVSATATSVTFTAQGTSQLYTALTSVTDLGCGSGCIFSVVSNGDTATFDLSTISVTDTSGLVVIGTGTANLTGFTSTPGTFVLTSQGTQGTNISFSTSVFPTPLPGALSLFAGGLGVFGLLSRRKKRKGLTAASAIA
jgi:hypothetical protein